MSNLYCPFGCAFEKPRYGANGYDWWVPLCPECEAPLKVRQPTQRATDVKPGPAEEVELWREDQETAHQEIMRKASRR